MQTPPIDPSSLPANRTPVPQPPNTPSSPTATPTSPTATPSVPQGVEPSFPSPLDDLAAFTQTSLAQATQLRVLALMGRVAELLLRLEGELQRLLDGPGAVPREIARSAPASPESSASPGSSPETSSALPDELVSRVSKLIARLAQIAPERAEHLLAKYQLRSIAFPESMNQLVSQLGISSEPSLEALVRGLLQPPPGGQLAQSPTLPIPSVLSDLLLQPEQMDRLLKFASEVAEKLRVGELQTEPLQGRGAAPPTGAAMDGITGTVMSSRPGPTGAASGPGTSLPLANPSLEAVPALFTETSVNVDVDVMSLSQQMSPIGRASGTTGLFTGIDVMIDMINVNQIIGDALGEDNPLRLSRAHIEVGVSVLQMQGQPQASPLDTLASDFAQQLVDLRQTDPAGFEKLIGLLRALAHLNPGKFDQMLARVEGQLRGIIASQGQMSAPAAAPVAALTPMAAQAPAAGGQATAGQTITVTVDVAVGQRTDMIISDLRAAGLEAQVVQHSSITQVQVQVTIGADGSVQRTDPLIIDLEGDGLDLTARETEFDINADGRIDRTSFIQGDDALLMIDQNSDGRLTDGRELFGDQEGDADGFAKLARFDDNRDGVIDAHDEVFDKLRVLSDRNRDGVTELSELASLREAGIESISLSRTASQRIDQHGNLIRDHAEVTRTDGTKTSIHEADLTHE